MAIAPAAAGLPAPTAPAGALAPQVLSPQLRLTPEQFALVCEANPEARPVAATCPATIWAGCCSRSSGRWHWKGAAAPTALATRAVYTFTGFPEAPVHHLYLHHDGYPTGAAWRFATALRDQPAAAEFLAAFLSSQPGAEALAGPEQAADADYRYVVELCSGEDPELRVQGWRRPPGITTWHPRCGPMALTVFIERFLPGGSMADSPSSRVIERRITRFSVRLGVLQKMVAP